MQELERWTDRLFQGEIEGESWVQLIDRRIVEMEVWQAMDMITDFFEFLQSSNIREVYQ